MEINFKVKQKQDFNPGTPKSVPSWGQSEILVSIYH